MRHSPCGVPDLLSKPITRWRGFRLLASRT
jgi:hypothetical protein